MRKLFVAIFIIGLCGCSTSGSKHTSVYRDWGERLRDMDLHNGRVEDVSKVIGNPPHECKPVENSRLFIGIVYDPEKEPLVITRVRPNSPAFRAGILPGDVIRGVGGQPVATAADAQSAFTKNMREGQAFDIETNRGVSSVVPIIQKAEMCYWDVRLGPAAKVARSPAAGNRKGTTYSEEPDVERFFRASCRIQDGFVVECQSNWRD